MITVAVFVFVSLACVATAFSQTIEKGNKMDVQKKNSSAEVSGHQLPEAKIIEPKLPDIEAKKLATDDKDTKTKTATVLIIIFSFLLSGAILSIQLSG